MFNKNLFLVIIFLFMHSMLWSQDILVTGELIFKLHNMPQHSIQFRIQAQDNVFDENKLYTTKYQGKTFTISQGATEINIDFCSDPSAGTVDTIGYSLYKITLDNDILYMDYRDCNYKYPGINWDVTFHYYYDTGDILWWDGEYQQWLNFNGNTFRIWRTRPDWDVYVPNTSCFRPAVLFQNQYGENSFGRLEIDYSYYVESGTHERFDMSTLHHVRSEFQKYLEGTGVPGKDLQHHDWNDVYENYVIEQDFFINSWLSEERAWFDELKPCTLKTDLLSGCSGGKVGFADPWFIEPDGSQPGEFHDYISPYIPADGFGVFLDQPYTGNNPYYSVRAAATQTIPFHGQDIEWNFQWWDGTDVQFQNPYQNETAVVFQQPNAVAKAVYKGHLASNTSEATSGNNGRKIAVGQNWQHAVYCDNGYVWYTNNDGSGWSPEICIDTGINPSISGGATDVHIVNEYEEQGERFVVYNTAERTGETWNFGGYTIWDVSPGVEATPVVPTNKV
jgi:hypothetical protein